MLIKARQCVSGADFDRSRGRQTLRLRVETMLRLAEFLSPADGALVQAVYGRGLRVSEFAHLANQQPRAARARLRRLLRRLAAPLFAFAAVHLDQWPSRRREAARLVILHGLTMRQAAQRLGLTFYQVRRECQAISALCEQTRVIADRQLGPRPRRRGAATLDHLDTEDRDDRGED